MSLRLLFAALCIFLPSVAHALLVSDCNGELVVYHEASREAVTASGGSMLLTRHGVSPSPAKAVHAGQKPLSARETCGSKRPLCSQLSSCEEAMRLLVNCGHRHLDRDRDGVPCEALCGGR